MLWIIVAVLVVLWLLGFIIFHVSGLLIHLLLVVARNFLKLYPFS